jgi:hypothetical protein
VCVCVEIMIEYPASAVESADDPSAGGGRSFEGHKRILG